MLQALEGAMERQRKVENTPEGDCFQYAKGGYLTHGNVYCDTHVISLKKCEGFKIVLAHSNHSVEYNLAPIYVLVLPDYPGGIDGIYAPSDPVPSPSKFYISERTKGQVISFCTMNGFEELPVTIDGTQIFSKGEPREIVNNQCTSGTVVFESGKYVNF